MLEIILLFVIMVMLLPINYWLYNKRNINIKVDIPSASNNNRYVAALEVVREYVKEVANSESSKFVDWLYQRLNPPKEADCT